MSEPISGFHKEYSFLSNFFSAPVEYCGYTFKNNEAAFQSMKCPGRAGDFCGLAPSEAKRLGRRVDLRDDWESVKNSIMYEVCRNKFTQNPELLKKLLETGDADLIEENTWGDRVWGVCHGSGENRLGQILMRIRSELQEKAQSSVRKISIDTPLGKLCACIGGDADYPEMFTYIERPDGIEIDLVAADIKTDDLTANAYLYGDTSTEDWTKCHTWSADDINIPCG